jgi:hypothetical protein
MFYCTEDSPESPPQNQDPAGTLFIKSNPSGARIYLMGTDQGKNTPDSIENLEAGTYDGFLYLQYYNTAYFTAIVINNVTSTKEIDLSNQDPTGKLFVTSNPSGAGIYLMGINTGKITPDTIKFLEPGIYDGFLYLAYYDTAYFTAQVINNVTTTKEITLEDGLPFVDFLFDYQTSFGGDSVRFNFTINQDVLMDSIVVERPNDSSGTYVISKYIFNKELFVWQNPLGNIIKYYLPPSGFGQQYYPRVEDFTYWFSIYGQKAYGAKVYFRFYYGQGV